MNREVSELLSGGAAWHLKVAGCFPKMLHGFSRRKAASGRYRARLESRELLAENAAQHFKVAGYFSQMLHGFSRRKAASGRCRAGFESRGLLPEDAVRHLKVASFFPEMLRGPPIFRCSEMATTGLDGTLRVGGITSLNPPPTRNSS